ncbi:DinB family protein [Capnocytophaga granulosa]|jgi:hypothetical protein|uniref:DinB family protein n=1 Tax=Capnocytophaga granulosa TaxID=45242 RepID=UPI0036169066
MKLDKSVFSLHKCIRERYLQYLEGFTLEQLAVIPQGFRNNLLWNISHAIVTQQLYCYYNSGLPMYVPEDFIAAYRKGTVPDGHVPTQEEVDILKSLLLSTQQQLEEDYQKGIFTTYTDYLTGLNYPLSCVEDAIYFNNTHEGMHLGLVIGIKYLV